MIGPTMADKGAGAPCPPGASTLVRESSPSSVLRPPSYRLTAGPCWMPALAEQAAQPRLGDLLTGRSTVRLVAEPHGLYDLAVLADWADSRFTCAGDASGG